MSAYLALEQAVSAMRNGSAESVSAVKSGALFGGPVDTRAKPLISLEEQVARRRAVDVARGSVRLEGFVLAPDIEAINRRYIAGELTDDEHVAAIRAAVLDE